MTLRAQKWWIAGGVVCGLLLMALYAIVDPATAPFPRCPFLMLTGLKCPGCGSQRAVHALLHADFATAWGYNALLVVSLPVVALMVYSQFERRKRPRLYNRLNSQAVIITALVVIIIWWIARNIWNF